MVNFLFDRTQQPHLTAQRLSQVAGVPQNTLAGKSKLIRDIFRIRQWDPQWCIDGSGGCILDQ